MDTKQLKQRILDLAIRGKLVPQDPNDEPASVLLERIRTEKEQLIAQGKLKKSKSKISDKPHYENVPFEIPESWEWTTVKEVCSKIGSGSTPRGSNYSKEGVPFFRSQNIYNHGIVYEDIKYISPDIHNKMHNTEVRPNDLLLNITGGSLGRCAVVPSNFKIGNVSQHVCIMRPVLILPQYLHAFCLSFFFTQTMVVSGSGREGLPKYSLENMLLPLPPQTEQQRIIIEIERWFKLIDDLESNKEDLKDYIKQVKSKVLSLAISGKLVPQDPNDEPAIELLKRINPNFKPCDTSHYENLPQGWCTCSFKDAFDITMGSSPEGSTLNHENDGIEFHQGKINFTEKYLAPSNIYTNSPTKFGEAFSILLCVRAPVGIVNITQRKICIGRGLCTLLPKKDIDLMFAFYAMQTYQDIFEAKATGTTFKAISGSTIRDEMFLLPPYTEQIRIRKKLDELWSIIDSIRAEL